MFGLFSRYFPGSSRAQFDRDLDEKNWVVLLHEAHNGRLRGFTAIHQYDTAYEGRTVSVIYSGDTVVDPRTTSMSSALSRNWIASVDALRSRCGSDRLLWFLIVSGFRTYRMLPVFWREFYPRYDAATPPATQRLLDFLATERFGSRYDRAAGIVRLAHAQVLCDDLCGIPERRLADPHVAFFAARNAGHRRGDELACITELSRENATPAGERLWRAARRTGLAAPSAA